MPKRAGKGHLDAASGDSAQGRRTPRAARGEISEVDLEVIGKMWKHMVRNTQQFLKRKGEIEFRDGTWQLVR